MLTTLSGFKIYFKGGIISNFGTKKFEDGEIYPFVEFDNGEIIKITHEEFSEFIEKFSPLI